MILKLTLNRTNFSTNRCKVSMPPSLIFVDQLIFNLRKGTRPFMRICDPKYLLDLLQLIRWEIFYSFFSDHNTVDLYVIILLIFDSYKRLVLGGLYEDFSGSHIAIISKGINFGE